MARLASQAKLGFYPTPPKTLELICKIVKPETSISEKTTVHIFDPCCGEGVALAEIGNAFRTQGSDVASYGVEIDAGRAAKSQKVLDTFVNCSIFDLTCTRETFSLLLLNPPYDFDYRTGLRSTRLEKTFFKETADYVAPRGVMILIVPVNGIDGYMAKSLTYRFENIRAFRMPVEEFQEFNQIVIFATRKIKSSFEAETAQQLMEQLYNSPFLGKETVQDFRYAVPATAGPRLFRDSHPTVDDMIKDMAHSPLNKQMQRILQSPEELSAVTPIMRLRLAHLANLLTAGFINGCVTNGNETIVVKGFTEQLTETRTEQVDASTVKVVETSKARACVRYFDSEGTLYEVR
ncbi:DUF6094 domain-containing protein [bacterium]|nr:DUF6094 domain-containing protein [bacterium]